MPPVRKSHGCTMCDKTFLRAEALTNHIIHTHGSNASQRVECPRCKKTYSSRYYLKRHVCKPAKSSRSRTLRRIPEFEDAVSTFTGDREDPLGVVLHRTWDSIKSGLRSHRFIDILNCRLYRFDDDESPEEPFLALERAWNRFECGAKINCSVGCVLRHVTDGTYRYYHSSSNNAAIFPEAATITKHSDLRDVFQRYKDTDIRELSAQRRPNTAWTLVAITNVTFYLYKLHDMTRVGSASDLPPHIRNNRFILSLNKCSKTGKVFDDNLCVFRCLSAAFSLSPDGLLPKPSYSHGNKSETAAMFRKWATRQTCLSLETVDFNRFLGISLDMLFEIEDIFDISITVFEMKEDKSSQIVWASNRAKTHTLNLIQTLNHFSLITDVEAFASSFSCKSCHQVFTRRSSLKRHTCNVRDVAKLVFAGGAFKAPDTIFDRLKMIAGIDVETRLRFYPYRITYDIECYLSQDDLPSATDKLEYKSHHKLLSISCCSNVPGFKEARCFVTDGDDQQLVVAFTQHLLTIAEEAEKLMRGKFSHITEQLSDITRDFNELEKTAPRDENESKQNKDCAFSRVMTELDVYLKTIPVISFNGQRYDLQVLKSELVAELLKSDPAEECDGMRFVIKKNSSMVCLESNHLRFIDITNFIAPGSTYASYLSAFGCSQEKGFFPYEWMDCLSKLDYTSLPAKVSFFSSLHNNGISEAEYAYCQSVWRTRDMRTFRDFLVWYNNLDVAPFLEALEKQCKIYMEQGIDLLKTNISLPGAAVRWMLALCDKTESVISRSSWQKWLRGDEDDGELVRNIKNKRAVFTVCDKYPDLYDVCKNHMVGGPSIVFHRYHESGVTKIRENVYGDAAKTCKYVQGYDANALYVWCLDQKQPVGRPLVRIYVDGQLSETTQPSVYGWSKAAHCWLEWVICSEGVKIRHVNNGGEVSLGKQKRRVDGYDPMTKTVYEFLGCYWHGHDCEMNSASNLTNSEENKIKRDKLKQKLSYLQHIGFNIQTMWECDWKNMQKTNANVRRFTSVFYKAHYPFRSKLESTDCVIKAIRNDSFFGFVECDINVPNHLTEKFSEMNPIFKNVDVSRDHLSPLMRDFAEKTGYLAQPQRMLVSSNTATRSLFHSELLKWYLSHGLIISKIYRTFQYSASPVYSEFVSQVTNARRRGDQDASQALLASTFKLAGNSVYGKTITNKEKHRRVEYIDDASEVSRQIRSRYFVSLEEFDSDICEVVLNKKKIKMDVPVIIGFSILQLAKLRMLQFYYDFMDKFVCRSNFQYVEMDTDSAYMALADSLENIIRPSLKAQFYQCFGDWFPRPYCSQHKQRFISTSINGFTWIPYPCCKDVLKSDARTPGLFKEEFQGTGIVALNSKTYFCWDETSDKHQHKLSCKGLSKRTNTLSCQKYKDVLFTRDSYSGINMGFVQKDGQTYTYQQSRAGLSFFYAKRYVCDDGISTLSIDI